MGSGLDTMVSSIWVAVMAGRPRAMHCRMISFWRIGSSSMLHSLPRSPRATMTAPEASMMAGRSSMAARVSTLATTMGPAGYGSTGTRARSSAERTNDTAIMSTPSSTKCSTASRSSGVGARTDRRSDGMWRPGLPIRVPPWATWATRRSEVVSSTARITRPSPMLRRSPGTTSSRSPP